MTVWTQELQIVKDSVFGVTILVIHLYRHFVRHWVLFVPPTTHALVPMSSKQVISIYPVANLSQTFLSFLNESLIRESSLTMIATESLGFSTYFLSASFAIHQS